jgi:hypothetical protein
MSSLPKICYHTIKLFGVKVFNNNIRLTKRSNDYIVWSPTWCTNSYLFTYNTFIKILYMFRALPSSSAGGLRRNCIYAASGIVTLCRWLSCAPVKKELPFSSSGGPRRNCIYAGFGIVTLCRWRLHIYNYDVDLLNMSGVMLETCRGF